MRASARRTDPSTSHEAANLAEKTTAKSDRERLLRYVLDKPGETHAEIANVLGMKASSAHKRLPELRDRGQIGQGPARKCRINGTRMMTWERPKPAAKVDEDGQERLF